MSYLIYWTDVDWWRMEWKDICVTDEGLTHSGNTESKFLVPLLLTIERSHRWDMVCERERLHAYFISIWLVACNPIRVRGQLYMLWILFRFLLIVGNLIQHMLPSRWNQKLCVVMYWESKNLLEKESVAMVYSFIVDSWQVDAIMVFKQ